jgi:hypothetical protein
LGGFVALIEQIGPGDPVDEFDGSDFWHLVRREGAGRHAAGIVWPARHVDKGKNQANASKTTRNSPKSNSHVTQKAQEAQAPEGSVLALRHFAVCVPFAPLASFAFNGSADLDAFALGQKQRGSCKTPVMQEPYSVAGIQDSE